MNLITFGDSWPEGGELEDPDNNIYGQLLANRLTASNFHNYGQSGSSLEHMINQLSDYVENYYDPAEQNIAIFFLTNPARSIYNVDNSWHFSDEDFRTYPSKVKEHIQQQYLHFHELDFFRASVTIAAIQHWCKQLNIKDFYFSGWIHYDLFPIVDTARVWKEGKETCGDWFGITKHNGEHFTECTGNKYIKPNYAHPNPEGHKLIADKLEPWILNNL